MANGTRKSIRGEHTYNFSSASREINNERIVERLTVITSVVTAYPVRSEEWLPTELKARLVNIG
jgi:hypothetical protein